MSELRVLGDGVKCQYAQWGGMTWPTPMDHPDGGLSWRLRYASPEQLIKDRYHAASVVEAYRELIALPEKRRNAVIRQLRKAIRLPLEATE